MIRLIKQRIAEIDPLAQVILFGSRARGDERKDSDWDVLILTNYTVTMNIEREFRNHVYELELETGEPFSVFAYSKTEWNTRQKATPFYLNGTMEGVLI